jgi:hypothetical protein
VKTPMMETAKMTGYDYRDVQKLLPGNAITAQECAECILRGVRRNAKTIAPSVAGPLWFVHRVFPFVTGALAASLVKKFAAIRRPELAAAPSSSGGAAEAPGGPLAARIPPPG